MKYLKYIESFDPVMSFDIKTLKNNINGLLIDLVDKGFIVYISVEDSDYDMKEMQLIVSLAKKRHTPSYFYPNDIKDYIDTLIDFIKASYEYDGLKVYTSQQSNREYYDVDFDSQTATFRLEFEYFRNK